MKTIYLAIESDLHAGHKLGLCNPETYIKEEDEFGNLVEVKPQLTEVQKHLWELRERNIAELVKMANGNPIVYELNGDATHGNRHPEQLMSTRIANQIVVGRDNMTPIAELPNCKMIRIITGTGSHVLGEGSTEYLISEFVQGKYPHIDTQAVNHWTPTINGIKCNFAHHGPGPSSRDWLQGNTVLQYFRDLLYKELWDGQEPTRLSVHSHYHTPIYRQIDRNGKRHMIIVTPSMCGLSDYGRQATKSAFHITWGMTVFEIGENAISEPIQLYDTLDIRTKENVEYGNDTGSEAVTFTGD